MKIIKPPRLKPGQTIGIASPSFYPDAFSLKAGIDYLTKQGYKVRLGEVTRRVSKTGFFAAPDKERADELNNMFGDPNIDAVFCAVGGYGAGRTLPLLNYDAVKGNPKILLGYSDITFLHIALYNKTGLITFHGPSASHLDQSLSGDELKTKQANFDRALKLLSGKSGLELGNPPGGMLLRTITSGKARGPLMGGNLETCEETLATPFEINLDRSLFFFEDVYASEEMVDRALTHLTIAGSLDNVAGVIAGEFTEVPKPTESLPSMPEVLRERIQPFKKPAILGLQCGHGKIHVTLPVGVEAKLDADKPSLTLQETPVD